jgi:hypothetical protein
MTQEPPPKVPPRPQQPRPSASGRRWSAAKPPAPSSSRWMFRLIGIPALAVAGVLIYRGVEDHFTLPACDSARAKATLADVLKQLKTEPERYEPIKTVSTSKNQVVCNAVLPLADGSNLYIDYSFFWQGDAADMRYSISRRPGGETPPPAPQVPSRTD